MTTRRQFLAGLGTAAVGSLAGCGALDGSYGNSEDPLEKADFEGWTPATLVEPSALPFELPETLFGSLEGRTRDLLTAVPEDPAIPNATIRQEIRADRSHVQKRIEDGVDADTAMGRLKRLHGNLRDAAELFGSYRAASGQNDGAIVADRRERIREDLAIFESSMDYAAPSTLEAVLVYAPVEDRLERAKHELPPREPYPDDPVANVEQAGRAYQGVESAAAALEAARGIRTAQHSDLEIAESRWSELATATRWLDISVGRTRSSRVPYPETADSADVFEFELSGVKQEVYRFARRDTQHTIDSFNEAVDTNRFGTAAVLAGQSLASIAAFEGVITAIRQGTLADEPSVESVRTAADGAHETLQEIPMGEYPFLSAAIGQPAVFEYRSGVRSAGEELFDPDYAEASFRHAGLLGAATNEAAAFVVEQLEGHP
ncbi:MAG: hypothetical protein U5K70_08970 [Halodesulfurarchaeum sp.]|nr:hypothetical protein [Halodesulfurarchaeum sp.]